tara:strand:+ start:214 stop:342 length:129 start_codon:yes stop_codon:yes gene_type:complete
MSDIMNINPNKSLAIKKALKAGNEIKPQKNFNLKVELHNILF